MKHKSDDADRSISRQPDVAGKLARYEAALRRIVEKPNEQEALMQHREKIGEPITDSDRGRFFAYLDVSYIAAEALRLGPNEFAELRKDPGTRTE